MKRLVLAATLAFVLAAPAWADFDDGVAAYERGDYATALDEWRRLAEQGVAKASYKLGVMYKVGQGVPQDFAEAVAWWRKAADQGDAGAQYDLGAMYVRGEGMPQDYVEGHMWRNLAASGVTGDERKKYTEARDALARQMTPAQLAEAQQRAADWQAAFEKRQAE